MSSQTLKKGSKTTAEASKSKSKPKRASKKKVPADVPQAKRVSKKKATASDKGQKPVSKKRKRDSSEDELVEQLRERVKQLEQKLAEQSPSVTAIVTDMDQGGEPNVTVYCSGPEAEKAWCEASRDALEGNSAIYKVVQQAPLTKCGEAYFSGSSYLDPSDSDDRFKLEGLAQRAD